MVLLGGRLAKADAGLRNTRTILRLNVGSFSKTTADEQVSVLRAFSLNQTVNGRSDGKRTHTMDHRGKEGQRTKGERELLC